MVQSPCTEPVAYRHYRRYGFTYPVYGDWQVEQDDRRRLTIPEAKDYGDLEVLRALWTLNRQAKRYRDRAKDHYDACSYHAASAAKQAKLKVYETKSIVLAVLLRLGRVALVSLTDGSPVFAVFRGEGYCFHAPAGLWSSPAALSFDGVVEAKPKTSREMRLRDAWATINGFLSRNPATGEDKNVAEASKLPPRHKPYFDHWDDDEDEWDDEDRYEDD